MKFTFDRRACSDGDLPVVIRVNLRRRTFRVTMRADWITEDLCAALNAAFNRNSDLYADLCTPDTESLSCTTPK